MPADQDGRPADVRPIPDPGFPDDDGSADLRLATALASYAADPHRHLDSLVVVQSCRVLVPVVAVVTEVEHDDAGVVREKSSEMATALLTGRDGRSALLGFTGLETLRRWRADARPVPVSARRAARSAVQEGADALVLDVAGPVTFPIEGEVLDALARGWTLVRTRRGHAWVSAAGE